MQITLKQRDIELALKMYLSAQGISLLDRSFTVEFTAGRKDSGLSASIDIGPAEVLATKIMQAVEATIPAPAPAPQHTAAPAEDDEKPEGEVTQQAALAASVPWQDEPEVPAQAPDQSSTVFITEAIQMTPVAETPASAPAPSLTSVSLFA